MLFSLWPSACLSVSVSPSPALNTLLPLFSQFLFMIVLYLAFPTACQLYCNELSQGGCNDQCMRCRLLRHSLCLTCVKRRPSSFALSSLAGEWRWEEASVLQDHSDAAESPAGGQGIAPSFPHCLHPLQPPLLDMLHGTGRLTAFLSLCMPSDRFNGVPVFNYLWCVLSQRINSRDVYIYKKRRFKTKKWGILDL